jgi:hypothetical protein
MINKSFRKQYAYSITKKDIINANTSQKSWSFYNQKEHLDNLLANRFNSLLVTYSLFLVTFIEIQEKAYKIIILFLGLLITLLVSYTIYEVYLRLLITLEYLEIINEKNMFILINKGIKKYPRTGNVLFIMSIVIPCILIISFITAILLILTKYISI